MRKKKKKCSKKEKGRFNCVLSLMPPAHRELFALLLCKFVLFVPAHGELSSLCKLTLFVPMHRKLFSLCKLALFVLVRMQPKLREPTVEVSNVQQSPAHPRVSC